jgi:hypothetical protein
MRASAPTTKHQKSNINIGLKTTYPLTPNKHTPHSHGHCPRAAKSTPSRRRVAGRGRYCRNSSSVYHLSANTKLAEDLTLVANTLYRLHKLKIN